ncbi:Arginine permease CAN1 [Vanrija pseudolonga]|uniref:Arginine permease CAN1 n=1 Tax=Vanrija pseudolonga TaxID=143232 RepID=A0AAF0YHT0_9TREE|nr:Arginine permease CAN1 [Vanrija pseudolonga]
MNGHGHEKDDIKDDLGFGDLSLGDTSEFANPNYAANGNGNGNGHGASTVKAAEAGGGFEDSQEQGLKRALTSRHISFIGFGGGIGVGLFVGIGQSLAQAGPAGIFLSFAITGVLVWCVIQSIGEIVTKYPVDASFPGLGTRFVDPAVGFTIGWTYWLNMAISVAVECTAIGILVEYWITSVNAAAWIAIALVVIYIFNMLPVNWYGEAEVATACIKVITLVGLMICGLVITLGGAPDRHRRGFEYWKNPGAFNHFNGIPGSLGEFLGFFYSFTNAAFAYGGTEVIVLAGAEAKNPSRQIPKNVRLFVYRQLFFYVGGSLMIGMIVPYNHPDLVNGKGNANSSPWVIAIKTAGIKALPSIINAAIITSALSAGNTYLYIAARTLRGMALNRQAPPFLTKTTRHGVPLMAVLCSAPLGLLAFLSVGSGGASQAFQWLKNLIALNNIMNWGLLAFTYCRFHKAMKAQDISRRTLVWYGRFQPYAAWFAVVFCIIVCIFQGFPVFLKGRWSGADFVASYISFVLYLIPYVGYKLFKRSKMVNPAEADLTSNIINPWDITEEPEPTTWYGKAWRVITH